MRLRKILICLAPLIFSFGCASTKQYVAILPTTRDNINSENARIYIFRTSVIGSALALSVKDGDQLIGELGKGRYLCWEREPGETTISCVTETDMFGGYIDRLKLKAEAGRTYYISIKARIGFIAIPPHNYPVLLTETAGQELQRKCKPADIIEE